MISAIRLAPRANACGDPELAATLRKIAIDEICRRGVGVAPRAMGGRYNAIASRGPPRGGFAEGAQDAGR